MGTNYLTFYDISIGIIWLMILIFIANSRKRIISNSEIQKYYFGNVLFKFFFSISFALIYLVYYGGGDTTAYWDGAIALNKMFYQSPLNYLDQMIHSNDYISRSGYFNIDTGYPPSWLTRESEAWFICKISSIISLVTFRSYFAASLVVAFFTAMASWRIFELVAKLDTHKTRTAAFCVLFVPTVSFWCTGISKDALVFISILNLIYYIFDVLILRNSMSLKNWILIIFSVYCIFMVRSFVLAVVVAPIFMSFGARLTKTYERNFFAKIILRFVILFGGLFLFIQFFASNFAAEMVSEAEIVQLDFTQNKTYTGKRYEISNTDASPQGLLRAIPESVFYGVFRPYFWESFSPNLILNGIESLVLMFLTVRFFLSRNVLARIKRIRKEEILVFALIFSLFIAFMAGFTSVLFGVLVRIRAPLLPFFFLVLTSHYASSKEKNEIELE